MFPPSSSLMKMVKVCGYLAMTILHLILLLDTTADCRIPPLFWNDYYCNNDVVVKGTIVNGPGNENGKGPQYSIKVGKVFKAPSFLEEALKSHSQIMEITCESLKTDGQYYGAGKEYAIAGKLTGKNTKMSGCPIIRYWEYLSDEHKANAEGKDKDKC